MDIYSYYYWRTNFIRKELSNCTREELQTVKREELQTVKREERRVIEDFSAGAEKSRKKGNYKWIILNHLVIAFFLIDVF